MFLRIRPKRTFLHNRVSYFKWYYQYIFRSIKKKFFTFIKKRYGRCIKSGHILCFSKGHKKIKNIFYFLNINFNFFITSFIISQQFSFIKKKIFSLCYNVYGGWYYVISTNYMLLFDYIGYTNYYIWKAYASYLQGNYSLLVFFLSYSYICLIGNKEKKNFLYVRSNFSVAILLSCVFFFNLALILLPSKKFKLFVNNKTYAFQGYVSSLLNDRGFLFKNAGLCRNLGKKAIVRGTVKNTCDHPNGGKRRALRCSYTPWGLVAKKSRRGA